MKNTENIIFALKFIGTNIWRYFTVSFSFGGKMCFANHINTVIFSNVENYAKKIQKFFFPKKRDVKSLI